MTSLAEAEVSERTSAENASAVCSQTLLGKSAVLNSSPRAPPLCTFHMLLLLLQMFVLFEHKCPAKWTSQDIPP